MMIQLFRFFSSPVGLLFYLTLLCNVTQASTLTIKSAAFTQKTGNLKVVTATKGLVGDLVLLHGEGGVLGTQLITSSGSKQQTFTIPLSQMAQTPCSVSVTVGERSVSKKIAGAPATCAKTPVCKIVSPVLAKGRTSVEGKIGIGMSFTGKATLSDKSATPLTYEWDFSGGAVGQPLPLGLNHWYRDAHAKSLGTTVTFVRGDSYYQARFAATDAKGRRCESTVQVKIGEPPVALDSVKKMAESAVKSTAPRGNELEGKTDDVVVLPFEQWSMSNDGDMKSVRNGYMAWIPLVTSLNAYAYKKGLKPVSLGNSEVQLRYSAGTNPWDPAGQGSINSTSRNYPLTGNNDILSADIQKTDIWNLALSRDRAPGTAAITIIDGLKDSSGNPVNFEVNTAVYRNTPWILDKYFTISVPDPVDPTKTTTQNGVAPDIDEGVVKAYMKNGVRTLVNDPNNTDHGRYMPGKVQPYAVNDPQDFTGFNPKVWNPNTAQFEEGKDEWWKANLIPITGIDDQGRDNIYNVLRVEAVDKSGATIAKTDGVLSSGRDFHCRECHAKGGIAAPENPPQTKAACRGSAYGANSDARRAALKRASYPVCDEKPRFFTVAEIGGIPGNLFDEEYVASINANGLHEFYDGFYLLGFMQHGAINSTSGKVVADRPMNCMYCHDDESQSDNFGFKWDGHGARNNINDAAFLPDYSVSMHRFHGELMFNSAKNGIERDQRGMFKRFDWRAGDKKRAANTNLNPNTLFPIFDANGKQLAMEENCLKCHGGKREQHYRDRMFTAGITCYDCHGDMLAMGGAFTKTDGRPGVKDPASVTDTSGEKHDLFRIPWYDQPDCGACHTGKGKDPVLKTAFDPLQPAQISFKPNLTDPNQSRFAVMPRVVKEIPMTAYGPYNYEKQTYPTFTEPVKIDVALFRQGKDTHGNVACAACHGAAHAIWPNRDPKANDNVTALQLQGHTGTILECNVCHSADAFKNEADLDGSTLYSGDPKPYILGGPHNTHPINDPYWYQKAGDGTNGGWHNNYATKSDKNNADQCAACHGADHLGTRLSKTPVDRVFKVVVDNKPKTVKVAAGTQISCKLCHTLEKSFLGTPKMTVKTAVSPSTPNNTTVQSGGTGPVVTTTKVEPSM